MDSEWTMARMNTEWLLQIFFFIFIIIIIIIRTRTIIQFNFLIIDGLDIFEKWNISIVL